MNYQEIIDKLEELDISVDNFAYEDYQIEDEAGLGEIVEIEQQGGEDEGSNWYSVKHFVDHNIYIKVQGYYQSHHGTDFYGGLKDCCSEVKPAQKTITVFE